MWNGTVRLSPAGAGLMSSLEWVFLAHGLGRTAEPAPSSVISLLKSHFLLGGGPSFLGPQEVRAAG